MSTWTKNVFQNMLKQLLVAGASVLKMHLTLLNLERSYADLVIVMKKRKQYKRVLKDFQP